MMTTLPSPPLSPMDTSYTSSPLLTKLPNSKPSYRKKAHHRHPPRRHDTFELIQALVIEHQRLEQQEYETMLREAPLISCRNTTNAPKGILVNNHTRPINKSLLISAAAAAAPPLPPRRPAATTTTVLNNSLPQSPHDTNDYPCSTTSSTALHSTQHGLSSTSTTYSPSSSSSIGSSPSTSSLVSSSSPPMTADSYSSSTLSSPSSTSSPSSSHITRHHVVRFAPGPPKIYTYQRIPILQES